MEPLLINVYDSVYVTDLPCGKAPSLYTFSTTGTTSTWYFDVSRTSTTSDWTTIYSRGPSSCSGTLTSWQYA